MSSGKGSLDIKDYPFAFSIGALFFPNLLTDQSHSSEHIFGIMLIGGMLGSLLTIINPLGLYIKDRYKKKYSAQTYNSIFHDPLIRHNHLIEKILQKNFKSAITSPSISFETDKIIAMIYFIIILSITIIRSFMEDFTTTLDNPLLIWGIRIAAGLGLIGVIIILINHAFGFYFKFNKLKTKTTKREFIFRIPILGLSQFDRICFVSISNLAIDFANLSNDGIKWKVQGTDNQTIREELLKNFYIFDLEMEKNTPNFSASYDEFRENLQDKLRRLYNENNTSFNEAVIHGAFQKYKSVKEIAWRYDVEFSEALCWFSNLIFFNPEELYQMEPQLRVSIESRDWSTAELIAYRIRDIIESKIRDKNLPDRINENGIIVI